MYDLHADSARLAESASIDWGKLEGRTVLITGATGLIGTHCARFLLERNRAFVSDIHVIAAVRSQEKAMQLLDGYGVEDGLSFYVGDLVDPIAIEEPVDYVIHAGCPTGSAFFKEHPVETARAIVDGTTNLLELARAQGACKSFVYVSSMEVYGEGNDVPGTEHLLREDRLGQVNPLSIRSCYPEGKRMAEQYCCSYADEYGVPAKIIRLAQTFGPGIPQDDRRVFAEFVRCSQQGRDIVLRTTGASTRMYLYTDDAVTAIFSVLLEGENGTAYNAANPATYSSVREMGEIAAHQIGNDAMGVRIEVDPNAPYPPEHHLPLDVSKLCALGWAPTLGLGEMLQKLADYLE